MHRKLLQVSIVVFSLLGLLVLYLFQDVDFSRFIIYDVSPIQKFIINKSLRFIANDSFAILLIYALFKKRKYVLFAFAVQLAGLLFFLLPYFFIKVYYPTYNGPLINFIHRIILNPTLTMLLIPAYYYQIRIAKTT